MPATTFLSLVILISPPFIQSGEFLLKSATDIRIYSSKKNFSKIEIQKLLLSCTVVIILKNYFF